MPIAFKVLYPSLILGAVKLSEEIFFTANTYSTLKLLKDSMLKLLFPSLIALLILLLELIL